MLPKWDTCIAVWNNANNRRPLTSGSAIGAAQECLNPQAGSLVGQLLAIGAERDGACLLLAVHLPPAPIGDPFLDTIALEEGPALLALLAERPWVRGLVFGHVHQYWRGWLPGEPGRPLLGCPSTLCPFAPSQPCPHDRAEDPGGLLLELGPAGEIRHRLLRWDPPEPP